MKINQHNTALHFLESGAMPYMIKVPNDWNHFQREYVRHMIEIGFPNKRELYKKKIQYISDPFIKAYLDVKDRIRIDLLETTMEESGTFIMRRKDGGRNTIFYTASISRDEEGTTELKGSCIIFGTDPEDTPLEVWIDIVYLLLFMRYCEVETKIVAAKRKADHVGQKYINETNQPIEIVDSTWFTTIIRSEGFGVKGHFRLQPYGPALTQRKLIYIAPFEKKGYTRRAKIERQKEGEA